MKRLNTIIIGAKFTVLVLATRINCHGLEIAFAQFAGRPIQSRSALQTAILPVFSAPTGVATALGLPRVSLREAFAVRATGAIHKAWTSREGNPHILDCTEHGHHCQADDKQEAPNWAFTIRTRCLHFRCKKEKQCYHPNYMQLHLHESLIVCFGDKREESCSTVLCSSYLNV